MTFHVLIVEDSADVREELIDSLEDLSRFVDVTIAGSRDEAIEKLTPGFLDLVILDLTIPTVTGALDVSAQHGHAVFDKIRVLAPGTPIFVLTGSPAEDFIPSMLKHQQQMDIWSEGQKTGTIVFMKKHNMDDFRAHVATIIQAVESLSDVELERTSLNLSTSEERLIRIFAKKYGGTRCVASSLGGGLSGARVVRLRVTDRQGALLHDAVAKLSNLYDVQQEGDAYDNHVTRLDPSATPRKLAVLEYGGHAVAGIFFSLARGFDESVFQVASSSPERLEIVVRAIERLTAQWVDGVPQTRMKVRTVRQRLLSDEAAEALAKQFGLDWCHAFEDREVQTKWGCSHGDLHGSNVLVSGNAATLIDYGDAGDGPASLDPVTLELSLVFHPDSPCKTHSWPTADQAKEWGNVESYVAGCPCPEFVFNCRAWALRVAAGRREVAAVAYSYVLRQLKYDDTDKSVALALLTGIRSLFENET